MIITVLKYACFKRAAAQVENENSIALIKLAFERHESRDRFQNNFDSAVKASKIACFNYELMACTLFEFCRHGDDHILHLLLELFFSQRFNCL